MAPLDLQGETLGKRHEHYNKLVKTAITNNQLAAGFSLDDTDVENLLKIDLACNNRDVDYIINVFKSGDMLYVSRALTQSIWLITDPQYAHVITPDYLHTQLLPHMSTKAFIKLNKHIRHNIQDEARAELFYLHQKKPADAIKWLPRCSVTFIDTNIDKHVDHCKLRTFKRLCEKSTNVFEIMMKKILYYDKIKYAQAVTFLLRADVDKYLDILEKDGNNYHNLPKFNGKATDIIMKNSPKRIMDKFDQYVNFIDIPTFSRYLKQDEIKTFLYTQAKKDNDGRYQFYNLRKLFNYDSMKYFIKRLPKTEQFDFVKKVFIDKENVDTIEENLKVGTESYDMKKLYTAVGKPAYIWYRFASFERAFEDITRIISKNLDTCNKGPMLKVLVACSDHNLQHIQTLLEYYLDKHKNETRPFTLNFTVELLNQTHIHQYDEKTWNLLNELFKVLNIYDESNSKLTRSNTIVESIIVYNLLRDQSVPAVIQKQFSSSRTLISYGSKLNEDQKEKIFRYLYEIQIGKFKSITKEEEFSESIEIIQKILRLLRDWKKELTDYPFVTDKVKECIKIKRERLWKVSLLPIYNFNKSWRKHMFEESVAINPCEEVCLNALKHDPQLLQRYKQDVDALQTNDAVSLRRLLAKLRVYWPHSLAQNWIDAYLLNLNRTDGHKATIRGICSAFPHKPLLEFINKYKPAQAKIDWNGIDDRVLSIQRFIAKNMHIARPQPSPDTILLYAKGDYLQFALPSLLAIFYNLNVIETQEHIPKLLDAPVSVQKHGIRLAYQKLDHETVKKIFFGCWKASKNASIRAIIFNFTFELLCREKDPVNAVSLWELIELFIENLTFEEDKKIYELMCNVEKVPLNVRAKYLMKSYKFMKSLTEKVKEEDRGRYQALSSRMAQHTREIMEDMSPEFITDILQEFIDKDFFGSGDNCGAVYSSGGILCVLSAYLLCAKHENIQTEKYEKVLVPLMHRAFSKWGEKKESNYVIRVYFQYLLTRLSDDLKEYVAEKKMIIPVKMFVNIQDELDKNVTVSENYMLLSKWKLTVAVAKLASKTNSDGKDWDNIMTEIAPEFGKICLNTLKEDVKLHFPCIYKLFCKVLQSVFSTLITEEKNRVRIYGCMLADTEFVQGYLTTIESSCDRYSYDKENYGGIWKKIFEHPSVEVKMHYYYRTRDERRF